MNITNTLEPESIINPICMSIHGSHRYGFADKNSDIDVRGVYFTDSESFFSLEQRKNQSLRQEGKVDLYVEELKKFLEEVIKGNPYRIEWISGKQSFQDDQLFPELQETVINYGLSKKVSTAYKHKAQTFYDLTKSQENNAKNYLHVLHGLMSGIHLLQHESIETDIYTLADLQKIEGIEELVHAKEHNSPFSIQMYENQITKLQADYREITIKSKLAEFPNTQKINEYHINFRKNQL